MRRAADSSPRFWQYPTFLLLAIPLAGAVIFPIATAGGTLLARQLIGEPT